MNLKFYTYQDIRVMAIKDGIPDNKVSIGIWAKLKGYYQTKKMTDGKSTILYYKKDGQ